MNALHAALDDLAREVREVDLAPRVSAALHRRRQRRYVGVAAAAALVVVAASGAVAGRLRAPGDGGVTAVPTAAPTAHPLHAPRYDVVWVAGDRRGAPRLHGLRDGRRVDLGAWAAFGADLSPDGTRLAFPTPEGLAVLVPGATAPRVHAATLTGPNGTSATPGAWSPDGETIAFTDPGPSSGPARGFGLLDVMSGAVTRVPYPHRGFPSWSPDGTTLALANAEGNGIDVVTLFGRLVRRIGEPGWETWSRHAWSPDGTALLVVESRPRSRRSLVVDARTGAIRHVLPLNPAYVWQDAAHVAAARVGSNVVEVRDLSGRLTRTWRFAPEDPTVTEVVVRPAS